MSSISDFFKERTKNLFQVDKEHHSPLGIKLQDGNKLQPSSAINDSNHCLTPTVTSSKGKILCWNSFGMVKMIKNEDNHTYEYVILSGKGINFNQIKLLLDDFYEIASISNTVVVLGRRHEPSDKTIQPKKQFTCICLKKWTKQHIWEGNLPFFETLKAVHTTEQFIIIISTRNIAYIYTLGGFLAYKWSLCGLYINGATFGDDIFSVACVLDNNYSQTIETYVYRFGISLLLVSKSSLKLLTNDDHVVTYTFTNNGILTVVTKLQFCYYSLLNSHVWCLYGRSSFEFRGSFVGISTHIVNQQIKMRCYIPSIIQNFEQYHLLDYKEVVFEPLTRSNTNNSYVKVIQNEIMFEEFKNKHNRLYKYEDSTIENIQREDILLDLFLYMLKNKEEILTVDMFLLLNSLKHIKSAIESASLSNQPKVISKIEEILAKRKEISEKLIDPSNSFECEIKELSVKADNDISQENIPTTLNDCREILRQKRSSFSHTSSSIKLKEINVDLPSVIGNDKTKTPKDILKHLLLRKK